MTSTKMKELSVGYDAHCFKSASTLSRSSSNEQQTTQVASVGKNQTKLRVLEFSRNYVPEFVQSILQNLHQRWQDDALLPWYVSLRMGQCQHFEFPALAFHQTGRSGSYQTERPNLPPFLLGPRCRQTRVPSCFNNVLVHMFTWKSQLQRQMPVRPVQVVTFIKHSWCCGMA